MRSSGRAARGGQSTRSGLGSPRTVAGFLDFWSMDRDRAAALAWSVVVSVARARGHPPEDAEDFAQTAVARLLASDAAGLRAMRPRVLLASALAGYLRLIHLESIRRTLRTRSLRGDECAGPVPGAEQGEGDADGAPPAATVDDSRVRDLSPGQRALVETLREGGSLAEVARTLGISVGAARMRCWRALRRVHSAPRVVAVARRQAETAEVARRRAEARRARAWAADALAAETFVARESDRRVLALLAEGKFLAEVAASLGLARCAAESRVARLRRKWLAFSGRRDAGREGGG